MGRKSYKNIDFEKNLTAASGKTTLEAAAPLWKFSHFGVETDDEKHCQLCHTKLINWVAIRNTENGVVQIIGHDCYDKLLAYLATKKLKSLSLSARKQYISEIKKYCKKHINASFLSWFKDRGNLPEEFTAALALIEKFGYAPSLEAAQALVAHYKDNRLFLLKELLDPESDAAQILDLLFEDIPATNPLSAAITLAQYEKMDLGFLLFDSIYLYDEDDELFRNALRRTLPSDLVGKPLQLNSPGGKEKLLSWIERAKTEVAVIRAGEREKEVIEFQKLIAKKQWAILDPDLLGELLGDAIEDAEIKDYPFHIALCETVPLEIADGSCLLTSPEGREKIKPWIEKARAARVVILEEKWKEAMVGLQRLIANNQQDYRLLSFYKGRNPKNGDFQWECRDGDVKYILARECSYDEKEGVVFVRIKFALVPGRVFLVSKLSLTQNEEEPGYYWSGF